MLELLVIDDNEHDLLLTELAFRQRAEPCTSRTMATPDWPSCAMPAGHDPRRCCSICACHAWTASPLCSTSLQHLRADSCLKSLPVFVMTSSTRDQDVARVRQLDADAFLVKPVDPRQVFELLRTLGSDEMPRTGRVPGRA